MTLCSRKQCPNQGKLVPVLVLQTTIQGAPPISVPIRLQLCDYCALQSKAADFLNEYVWADIKGAFARIDERPPEQKDVKLEFVGGRPV